MNLKYSLPILMVFAAQESFGVNIPTDQQGVNGSIGIGGQMSTGNTNTNNITSNIHVDQNLETWRNHYSFESIRSQTDYENTSEIYRASLQSDYKFTDKKFLYLREEAEKDLFSGYKYKTNISTGYGNRVWNQKDGSFLEASAGIGYRRNQIEEGTEANTFDSGAIGRFALKLTKKLSPSAVFRQSLTIQLDLEHLDTVTESVTSISASVWDNLALQLSYRVEHSSYIPSNGEKTDTETTVTLLYSF